MLTSQKNELTLNI